MITKREASSGLNVSQLMLSGSFGVFVAVFLFSVILMVFTSGFLTTSNFFSTSRTFAMWIIVGFAQMLALTIGHMNLSAGAIGGLAAVMTGWLFQDEFPIWGFDDRWSQDELVSEGLVSPLGIISCLAPGRVLHIVLREV